MKKRLETVDAALLKAEDDEVPEERIRVFAGCVLQLKENQPLIAQSQDSHYADSRAREDDKTASRDPNFGERRR